eukprot:symbB.v1.2.012423.t1/scaffold849.1/size158081/6
MSTLETPKRKSEVSIVDFVDLQEEVGDVDDECEEYTTEELQARLNSKRITSPISLKSDFITKAATQQLNSAADRSSRVVTRILWHPITGNCLGLLTLFDAYLSCADIDRRAAGLPEPAWLSYSMDFCLAAYTVEYVMWCYVRRFGVLRDKMLVVDLFIILCGFAEWILSETMTGFLENFNLLRMFRVARIIRLLKLFRRFSYLKEFLAVILRAMFMWGRRRLELKFEGLLRV